MNKKIGMGKISIVAFSLVLTVLFFVGTFLVRESPFAASDYVSPMLYPRAVIALFAVIAGMVCIKELKRENAKGIDKKTALLAVASMAIMLVSITLMETLGFCISGCLFFFGQLMIFHQKSFKAWDIVKTLLWAALISTCTMLTFRFVFRVILPTGFLGI